MQKTRLAIVGLGNVGRRLLELIQLKRDALGARFDLEFVIVGVCDSTSGAADAAGLDCAKILELKRAKRGLATYFPDARVETPPCEWARTVAADIVVELTTTNLKDGEPGLGVIRDALARKIPVVTANKGPLVFAYPELAALARQNGVPLLHSAAVTGGLPTLNIGTRDLGVATIEKFEGVVNGTTNYILSRMAQGQTYTEALKHAQDIGMAEADPSLDVDGWDAAAKLVIIANAVLHRPTTLKDVTVEGIRKLTPIDLITAEEHRQTIKLIALAERVGKNYNLSVQPTWLDKTHPLARLGAGTMGVIYETDINGTIFASIEEEDPYPTAAAVLRDLVQCATRCA
ncbi:MAG: homoserine dehydrogenase [Anaerolineales bacterium]|nr:homoserine dehydrogenase [Anaerolineales bacterium]